MALDLDEKTACVAVKNLTEEQAPVSPLDRRMRGDGESYVAVGQKYWQKETWTRTCGPIPSGLILTHSRVGWRLFGSWTRGKPQVWAFVRPTQEVSFWTVLVHYSVDVP